MPALLVLFCYGWWNLYPVLPGYAIAALAFAAVIMTVRADRFQPAEKVIWVLIGAGLMLTKPGFCTWIGKLTTQSKQRSARSRIIDSIELLPGSKKR